MGDQTTTPDVNEVPIRLTLRPYLIAQYETTRAQWHACVADSVCPELSPAGERESPLVPATGMRFSDIEVFLKWLTKKAGRPYRLPSEAEWEFAARAGSQMRYPWGNDEARACLYGNVADMALRQRHPLRPLRLTFACNDGSVAVNEVGRYLPNPFRLYDLMGNVGEYVADDWSDDLGAKPSDGGPYLGGNSHVIRGGDFETGPLGYVSTRLLPYNAELRGDTKTGFRVARDQQS